MERTYRFSQQALVGASDATSARKAFDLSLPDLGPYCLDYTPNGRHMLIGGRRGHLALFDWTRPRLVTELQARSSAAARLARAEPCGAGPRDDARGEVPAQHQLLRGRAGEVRGGGPFACACVHPRVSPLHSQVCLHLRQARPGGALPTRARARAGAGVSEPLLPAGQRGRVRLPALPGHQHRRHRCAAPHAAGAVRGAVRQRAQRRAAGWPRQRHREPVEPQQRHPARVPPRPPRRRARAGVRRQRAAPGERGAGRAGEGVGPAHLQAPPRLLLGHPGQQPGGESAGHAGGGLRAARAGVARRAGGQGAQPVPEPPGARRGHRGAHRALLPLRRRAGGGALGGGVLAAGAPPAARAGAQRSHARTHAPA